MDEFTSAPDAAIAGLGEGVATPLPPHQAVDPVPYAERQPDQTDSAPAPTGPRFPESPATFTDATPAVPFVDDSVRPCVVCAREFDARFPGQRCESRYSFCSRCCPHESCHAASTLPARAG